MDRPRIIKIIMMVFANILALGIFLKFKSQFDFADPWIFWLLLFIPALSAYTIFWGSRHAPLRLSSFSQFEGSNGLFYEVFIQIPSFIRALSIVFLILALARPQSSMSWQNKTTEGIDIVIAMDISVSMLAKDFDPNRLESAKKVAIEFIEQRPNDRIGLVVYEGESFTQCPLTTDHKVLINLFKDVHSGMVEGGTAIGMGLATGVNRLKESDAKSKVVILLTDGDNNAGSISPTTAAEIAQTYGVRVYTIGVGSRGRALAPVALYHDGRYKYDYVEVKIDEEGLQQIANMTGGKYFRATNSKALEEIYTEIDRLEKTKINVVEHSRKSEKFFGFALFGIGLLFFEFLFRYVFIQTLT